MAALVAATPASAPRLAALEWTSANVDRELVSFFSDELARALRSKGLRVVTSSDMAAVLGVERQRQLLGCDDRSACLMELGNALGCDALLAVSLAKLSGTWRANVKVLSSRDGATLAETVVESDSDKGFTRALDGAADRIALTLSGGPAPEVTQAVPLRQRAWIPLLGGGALLVAGGVLLGLAVWTSSSLDAELSTHHLVTGRAVVLASQGKTFQTTGWVGLGIGLAALGVAGAMFLFGAEPPLQPAVSLTPHGASLGLSWSWP